MTKRRYVNRNREPKTPPPLPKEVTPTGPREYVDRWGVPHLVVWSGEDKHVSPSSVARKP